MSVTDRITLSIPSSIATKLNSQGLTSVSPESASAFLFKNIMEKVENNLSEDARIALSPRVSNLAGQQVDLESAISHDSKLPTLAGLQTGSESVLPHNLTDVQQALAEAIQDQIEVPEDMSWNSEIQAVFTSLWEKISPLLQLEQLQHPTNKITLHNLLEQWTTMEKQIGKQVVPQDLAETAGKTDAKKEQEVWGQLLDAFRKRGQMNSQQRYTHEAGVSSKDIGNWLKQALSRYQKEEIQPVTTSLAKNLALHSMPVSQVEQFEIHLQQTGTPRETMDKQLLEQFQRALKTSEFLAKSNGEVQLLLKIKPVHLGEMTVQLTKVNGEIAVKVMVATQVVKEALEGNMQQLKHLFAPHQVIIEKQEVQAEQSTYQYDEQRDKDKQEQPNHGDAEQDVDLASQEETDATPTFSQILMNERV